MKIFGERHFIKEPLAVKKADKKSEKKATKKVKEEVKNEKDVNNEGEISTELA